MSESESGEHTLKRTLGSGQLIALGIGSVGHRRKLLDAIAVLQGGAAPAADRPAPLALSRAAAPERRQLTVLFCDLVGSTELATRLDPRTCAAS